MKKNISLATLFLLAFTTFFSCFSCQNNQQKNTENQIDTEVSRNKGQILKDKQYAIAFYNVENLFDTIDDPTINDEDFLPNSELQWTEKRYLDKLDKLAEVISKIGDENGPEIIGLCEVENLEVLQDLVKNKLIADHNYQIVHFNSPDMRGIDVALLYKPNAFELLEKKSLRIDFPDGKTLSRDILQVKGILAGKDETHFFVNHWPSRRGGAQESSIKRETAAAVARKAVEAILAQDPQAKIILMGDFNDEPTNKSVQEVLLAKEKPLFSKQELLNPMHAQKAKGLGTHNYNSEWNMLDQFMISQAFVEDKKIHYVNGSAQIFSPEWLKQQTPEKYKGTPFRTYAGKKYLGGYSDHFPIFLHIKTR